MSAPTRRTVLGAAAAALLGTAGCSRAGSGSPLVAATVADVRVQSGTLRSRHVPDREVGWTLALPPAPGALVVALHGSPGAGSDWVNEHGAVGAARDSRLAIVGVDGDDSWWHPRREGVDAGTDYQSMIVDDLLPAMASRGLPTARIGLLGLSMGGYGALLLAERLGTAGCLAVATMSAALYLELAQEESGAFDDAADFAEYDVIAHADRLARLPVWLAVGRDDAFLGANEVLAQRVSGAVTLFDEGGHDHDYWARHIGSATAFLAAHA